MSTGQSDEAQISVLIVAVKDWSGPDWVDASVASEWATKVIKQAVEENGTRWEGGLTVTPLSSTPEGKRFRLRFTNVPEALISSVVMPAFEAKGTAHRLGEQELHAQSTNGEVLKRRLESAGNFDKMYDLVTELKEKRDSGGSESRKRRFYENLANRIDRTHRITTNGMKQLREDTRDDVD